MPSVELGRGVGPVAWPPEAKVSSDGASNIESILLDTVKHVLVVAVKTLKKCNRSKRFVHHRWRRAHEKNSYQYNAG